MAQLTGLWAFHKGTGTLTPVTISAAITALDAGRPADESRFPLVSGLRDGGMLETRTHAYSTRPANFKRFIRRAA